MEPGSCVAIGRNGRQYLVTAKARRRGNTFPGRFTFKPIKRPGVRQASPSHPARISFPASDGYGFVFDSLCSTLVSPVIGFLVTVVSSCLWPPNIVSLSDSE